MRKGGETDDDQTIDPHTSLISARPSFLWWWYACLTVKCIDAYMSCLKCIHACVYETVDFEKEKTNEIYENMQEAH